MTPNRLTGRALDALIAQCLFGREVEPRVNPRTGEQDFVQCTPSGNDWVRVAFYSSSMAASRWNSRWSSGAGSACQHRGGPPPVE